MTEVHTATRRSSAYHIPQYIARNKSYDEISPYLNTLSFYDFANDHNEDLLFDISKFKADKQVRADEQQVNFTCDLRTSSCTSYTLVE